MTDQTPEQSPATPIVALIGRPNVGKSTLFNRITRSRRAIVDPTPGVTRDRHYERVHLVDRVFILVDTGGLEAAAENTMAGRIREQTMQAIQEADILFLLLDAREGLTPTDLEIAGLLRRTDKPTYFLVNKVDGPELEQSLLPQFYELGVERLWPVAAEHGYGIPTLLEDLHDRLRPAPTPDAAPADIIRLACFGRPNVGKSSLVNRLLGEERMLVSEIPGTTRDAVDTLLTLDGQDYLLIDTAGIRRKGKVQEKIEKFSVIRALATLDRCDIVLILIDAGEGITEQDTKVIGYALDEGRACMLLINKWDLLKGDTKRQKQLLEEVARATIFVEYAPVLTISALTGAGIKRIFPVIKSVFRQYTSTFPTNRLNLLLQEATAAHPPAMSRGKRLKFYFTTQLTSRPPTFALVANYPKDLHFSYQRYLTNFFRKNLKLDKAPLRLFFRERKRRERVGPAPDAKSGGRPKR
ncbi:MAG: ribosome biogenesis GTPase Der [Deltaproteobacteria bacterium RIFOXYD12_FULL_57_12]|nr:MAG: ribosome biogenesis GTPase Der [Deltaproteobacteria bacterium RIFOXYD12_FULL_57_12]